MYESRCMLSPVANLFYVPYCNLLDGLMPEISGLGQYDALQLISGPNGSHPSKPPCGACILGAIFRSSKICENNAG